MSTGRIGMSSRWTGDDKPLEVPPLPCRECGAISSNRVKYYFTKARGSKWVCQPCEKQMRTEGR